MGFPTGEKRGVGLYYDVADVDACTTTEQAGYAKELLDGLPAFFRSELGIEDITLPPTENFHFVDKMNLHRALLACNSGDSELDNVRGFVADNGVIFINSDQEAGSLVQTIVHEILEFVILARLPVNSLNNVLLPSYRHHQIRVTEYFLGRFRDNFPLCGKYFPDESRSGEEALKSVREVLLNYAEFMELSLGEFYNDPYQSQVAFGVCLEACDYSRVQASRLVMFKTMMANNLLPQWFRWPRVRDGIIEGGWTPGEVYRWEANYAVNNPELSGITGELPLRSYLLALSQLSDCKPVVFSLRDLVKMFLKYENKNVQSASEIPMLYDKLYYSALQTPIKDIAHKLIPEFSGQIGTAFSNADSRQFVEATALLSQIRHPGLTSLQKVVIEQCKRRFQLDEFLCTSGLTDYRELVLHNFDLIFNSIIHSDGTNDSIDIGFRRLAVGFLDITLGTYPQLIDCPQVREIYTTYGVAEVEANALLRPEIPVPPGTPAPEPPPTVPPPTPPSPAPVVPTPARPNTRNVPKLSRDIPPALVKARQDLWTTSGASDFLSQRGTGDVASQLEKHLPSQIVKASVGSDLQRGAMGKGKIMLGVLGRVARLTEYRLARETGLFRKRKEFRRVWCSQETLRMIRKYYPDLSRKIRTNTIDTITAITYLERMSLNNNNNDLCVSILCNMIDISPGGTELEIGL